VQARIAPTPDLDAEAPPSTSTSTSTTSPDAGSASEPTMALERELSELRRHVAELEARQAADHRNALAYSFAYRQVASVAYGIGPHAYAPPSPVAPSKGDAQSVRWDILEQRRKSMLVDEIACGSSIEEATIAVVRAYLPFKLQRAHARPFCEALTRSESTKAAGHLGCALLAHVRECDDKAWDHLRHVPEDIWRRLAPVEYLEVAFTCDQEAALAVATHLLDTTPDDVSPDGWLVLARETFAAGRLELARRACELASANAAAKVVDEASWILEWIDAAEHPPTPTPVEPPSVAIAVVDYKQPDRRRTSGNIGDYIQTLASLGHVVRRSATTFSGPADLADLAARLRARVRPNMAIDRPPVDVTLIPVDRDATNLSAIPDATWMIAFGWHMHPIMGRHLDFPFHPNLRPIFVSFHCRRRALLTDGAIEYLRRYGPVGCRDWNTVDLLLSVDVPAFFTGCITTTIGTLFPNLDTESGLSSTAYVDSPAPPADANANATSYEHSDDAVRTTGVVANLDAALDRLDRYRSGHDRVVTSRLHCYLPVRALGMPVEFVPPNPADVRFNGLTGLDDVALARMRAGIDDRLESVLDLVLGGAHEDSVYEQWRTMCADDVADARRRLESVPPMPPPGFDVTAACAQIRSERVDVGQAPGADDGNAIDVAFALDDNLTSQLEVVVEALTTNTGRPVHAWVLCRGHGTDDFEHFGRLFPQVTWTWLPCDHVDYGEVIGMVFHTTVSTFDRLLLPELLPELDRIVYLDIDTLALGDVGDLYDLDLHGAPGAARSPQGPSTPMGYEKNVERPANRLGHDPGAANDLYRRMFARHPYNFRSCNAGVLVFDLGRMRDDAFVSDYVPFLERYGMHDQEALNCYFGGERGELPPEWNHLVVQDPCTPRIHAT